MADSGYFVLVLLVVTTTTTTRPARQENQEYVLYWFLPEFEYYSSCLTGLVVVVVPVNNTRTEFLAFGPSFCS